MSNKQLIAVVLISALIYVLGFLNGGIRSDNKINLSKLDIEKQLIIDNYFTDYGSTADVTGLKQGKDTLWQIELLLGYEGGSDILAISENTDLEGAVSDLLYYLKDNLKNDDWNRKTLKIKK